MVDLKAIPGSTHRSGEAGQGREGCMCGNDWVTMWEAGTQDDQGIFDAVVNSLQNYIA